MLLTKKEFLKGKEKLKSGFIIFNEYPEYIVKFNKKTKTLNVIHKSTSYAGPCSTEREAISKSLSFLNNWLKEW